MKFYQTYIECRQIEESGVLSNLNRIIEEGLFFIQVVSHALIHIHTHRITTKRCATDSSRDLKNKGMMVVVEVWGAIIRAEIIELN